MRPRRQVSEDARPRFDPVACDAIAALLCAAALLGCAAANADKGGHVDDLAVLIALAACAPVALRSIDPLWALTGVSIGAFASLATFKPQAMVILPVAYVLYAVALHGTRARTAWCAGVSVVMTVAAMDLFSHRQIWSLEVLEKMALVLLPLVAGEAMREHLAFKQEQAEQMRSDADRRVEQERLRIAREVHDVVAHSMVAINVQAGVAAHLMDRRPEAAHEALLDIKKASGDALRDLRATLGVLRDDETPAPVRPSAGLDALDELAAPLRAAGIEVRMDVDRGTRLLPSALEGAGFRIVQEALTNVLRHSGASSVSVAVTVDWRGLWLEVVDSGPPAPVRTSAGHTAAQVRADAGTSNGLRGMRERAAAVGGELEAGPRPEGGGWRVAATLPIGATA